MYDCIIAMKYDEIDKSSLNALWFASVCNLDMTGSCIIARYGSEQSARDLLITSPHLHVSSL